MYTNTREIWFCNVCKSILMHILLMCENQQNLDLSWGMYMSWCMSCCHQIFVIFYYDLCKLSWLLIMGLCTFMFYYTMSNALTLVVMSCLMKIGSTFCDMSMLLNWANLGSYIIIWYYDHEKLDKPKCEKNNYFSYLTMISQYMNKSIMLWNVGKNVIMTSLPSRILKRKQSFIFNFNQHNWVRFKVLKEGELLVKISMKRFILKPTIQIAFY
jgi:hypothetical protein